MFYDIDTARPRNTLLSLTTDRLRMSVLKKSEYHRVGDYLRRNRDFHKEFSQTHDDQYFTDNMQKGYLEFDAMSFKDGNLVPLWITLKGSDVIIGRVSFFNLAYGGMMNCATGYHLDKDHTGNGYMTEALRAGCQFMFKEYKMHRIEAFILPENKRSIDLVNRLGFAYEGKRVSYMHINGAYRDHEAYYMLSDSL